MDGSPEGIYIQHTYCLDATETGVLSMLASLRSWSFRFCARSASDISVAACMRVCVRVRVERER